MNGCYQLLIWNAAAIKPFPILNVHQPPSPLQVDVPAPPEDWTREYREELSLSNFSGVFTACRQVFESPQTKKPFQIEAILTSIRSLQEHLLPRPISMRNRDMLIHRVGAARVIPPLASCLPNCQRPLRALLQFLSHHVGLRKSPIASIWNPPIKGTHVEFVLGWASIASIWKRSSADKYWLFG